MKHKAGRAGLYLSAFLIFYFAFETWFVSAISLGAGLDDAELISNISFWNWGYGGSQPPLYTWLAYGLTQFFGLHFALLQFLRFSLLASGFFAVYIGLWLLAVRPALAAFAVLSMFLLPQIAWESQRALIHSVLGTAGSAWSFAAFIWFAQKPGYKRAAALGAAIAIAVLGKYNGLIFIAALFLSGFLLPPVRRALTTRYFAAAIVAALLFMTPALVFMALHPNGVVERAVKFHAGAAGHFLADRVFGLLDLARASVTFALPALLLALIFAAFARRRKQIAGSAPEAAAQREKADTLSAMRFLRTVLLCGLGLCAVLVLFSGATHIKDRWLQPILFLAPPYAALWLAQTVGSARAARAFGLAGVIAACLVPPLLYANLYMRGGKMPLQNLDYPALYADLSANGKIAAILAPNPFYAGNIRLLNPQIKTLFAETPAAAARLARPLVILWSNTAELPQKLRPILAKAGIETQTLPPARRIDVPYRPVTAAQKTERIYYLYLR